MSIKIDEIIDFVDDHVARNDNQTRIWNFGNLDNEKFPYLIS